MHTCVSLTGTIPGEEPSPHVYPETPELLGPQRNSKGDEAWRPCLAALYCHVGFEGAKPLTWGGSSASE